jgi:hypothetical protein
MSWHAAWGGPERTRLPCAVQFVCKRHIYTIPPRRVSAIRRRRGSRSHVPQFIASSRLFVSLSTCYGTAGLPSMSQREQLCSLLRLRDASKSTDQSSFSDSQYSGSKQQGILGWPFILSWPTRHTPTRQGKRNIRDWACLTLSLTGEAACPSETVCYYTSSLFVLWWIMKVKSGSPLLVSTSGSSKCCNSSLRITTKAPWCISNRQIHEDLGIPFFADHIRALTESFDSKVTDVWTP